MMYDIYFDPSRARWRIRMVYPMLVFFTTTREVYDAAQATETDALTFETFDAAKAYTDEVGLSHAYTMRYPKRVPTRAEVVHGAENYAHQNAALGYRP